MPTIPGAGGAGDFMQGRGVLCDQPETAVCAPRLAVPAMPDPWTAVLRRLNRIKQPMANAATRPGIANTRKFICSGKAAASSDQCREKEAFASEPPNALIAGLSFVVPGKAVELRPRARLDDAIQATVHAPARDIFTQVRACSSVMQNFGLFRFEPSVEAAWRVSV